MKDDEISEVLSIIRDKVKDYKPPTVGAMTRDPFKVLISTIISLRTKDAVTEAASKRLFSLADTPEKMMTLSPEEIEKAIYPTGFYKRKSINILELSKIILDQYEGIVPDTVEELLKLKGVGRKTANLTVTLGYNTLGICVDVHVHRITNRWGYVKTSNPDETEFVLREKLPERHWIEINDLLVCYGQNLCTPISPHCSKCPVFGYCDRVGVTSNR
ncbi:endonuclease III [bacterium]|nr:MAG: endonuclease III [bacterium]